MKNVRNVMNVIFVKRKIFTKIDIYVKKNLQCFQITSLQIISRKYNKYNIFIAIITIINLKIWIEHDILKTSWKKIYIIKIFLICSFCSFVWLNEQNEQNIRFVRFSNKANKMLIRQTKRTHLFLWLMLFNVRNLYIVTWLLNS